MLAVKDLTVPAFPGGFPVGFPQKEGCLSGRVAVKYNRTVKDAKAHKRDKVVP